jgi:hypothetical protein
MEREVPRMPDEHVPSLGPLFFSIRDECKRLQFSGKMVQRNAKVP